MNKEIYLVQFETQQKANYWMLETIKKFESDIVSIDKRLNRLDFLDSSYYFWSYKRAGAAVRNAKILNPADLYIILDDPERKRLPSFEEAPEGAQI